MSNDYEYVSIRKRLHDLPALIADKQRSILKERIMQQNLQAELKRIECSVMVSVSSETDDQGKKRYSNEALRDTEKLHRLSENLEYQSIKTESQDKDVTVKVYEIELEQLKNEFSALKHELYCVLAHRPVQDKDGLPEEVLNIG